MVVIGDRTFKEAVRCNEVIKVGPRSDRISVLIGRDPRELSFIYTKERPCEDLPRRWLSTSQKESYYQKQNGPKLWSLTLAFSTVRNKFLCLSYLVPGALLWQAELTDADGGGR